MSLGFDTSGHDTPDRRVVIWQAAPGSPYATLQQVAAAIPHFGPFLLALAQRGTATLAAFSRAIDETMWTTAPMGAAFDQSLAVLVGRPLALVRAALRLELDGTPYLDPSWQFTFAPAGPAVTGYEFAIELGNEARLADGLIGYFVEDNYDRFNVVTQAGAHETDYLHPIGVDHNYLFLPPDAATAIHVSMLIDPRAAVHATSAILPTMSVSLPPDYVSEALAAIDVTFRVNGILTDQTIPADAEQPTILLPVPKEKAGRWTWLENNAGDVWTSYQTAPNDTTARLSTVAPVIRRGLLRLSSAIEDETS